jgi:hypothetical protein
MMRMLESMAGGAKRAGAAAGLLVALAMVAPGRGQAADTLTAKNLSYPTTCAEEDNINVPLRGAGVLQFEVRATHPAYDFLPNQCEADFSGCPSPLATTSAALRGANLSCQQIFDDGVNVFNLCTEPAWWRPYAMTVRVAGAASSGHRLVLNRKIADAASWPEVLVVYQDGNVRVKPHPPAGVADVCFGSSVIVGPAAEDPRRPYVDIAAIDIEPTGPCFDLTYLSGGRSRFCLAVNRQEARLNVVPSHADDPPFATFRSMWVEDGNADVDQVTSPAGAWPILGPWAQLGGPWWSFERRVRSRHNTSAPDVRITASAFETGFPRPAWRHLFGQ